MRKWKLLVDNRGEAVGTRYIVIDEFGLKPKRTLDSGSLDMAKHTVARHPQIFGTAVRICSLQGETLTKKGHQEDWI